MKYLNRAYLAIDGALRNCSIQLKSVRQDSAFRLVFDIIGPTSKRCMLVFDGVDTKRKCGFVCYCYIECEERLDDGYLPVDLPSEVLAAGKGAFDIALLQQNSGRFWSLLNDAFDGASDGVFSGGEEKIIVRCSLVASKIEEIVENSLIGFLHQVGERRKGSTLK